MKVKTFLRRSVSREWVTDTDIKNYMIYMGLSRFTYERIELLNINDEDIVNSYLDLRGSNLNNEPGYWYSNQLYDMVHKQTKFLGGDEEDMEYEIVEPNYPTDIPWADQVFQTVEEFRIWMINKGMEE